MIHRQVLKTIFLLFACIHFLSFTYSVFPVSFSVCFKFIPNALSRSVLHARFRCSVRRGFDAVSCYSVSLQVADLRVQNFRYATYIQQTWAVQIFERWTKSLADNLMFSNWTSVLNSKLQIQSFNSLSAELVQSAVQNVQNVKSYRNWWESFFSKICLFKILIDSVHG